MRKLYTVDDLAKQFSRSKRTIRDWIAEGLFPHAFMVKDGWYVPEKDVDAIMNQKCELAAPPPGLEKQPSVKHSKGFVTRWK